MRLVTISEKLGSYPHKALNLPPPRPSNATRAKAKCPQCGYEVSLLKRWSDYGPPICPKDKIRMEEYAKDIVEQESPDAQKDDQTVETVKEIIHRAIS